MGEPEIMTLSEKQRKFTVMVGVLIRWADDRQYGLTFGHAWRDTETQRRLVEQKLSKTMQSKHCDRLAVDLNLFRDGIFLTKTEDYKLLGEFWKTLDPLNRWGGDWSFGDGNHFEYAG